jgi:hypothetical protein
LRNPHLASIRLSLEMCVTTKIMVHKHVARLPVRAAAVTGCSREGASLTPRFNDVASITQNAVWSWPGPALRRQEAPVMWWRRRATLQCAACARTSGHSRGRKKRRQGKRAGPGVEQHPAGDHWPLHNRGGPTGASASRFLFFPLSPGSLSPTGPGPGLLSLLSLLLRSLTILPPTPDSCIKLQARRCEGLFICGGRAFS